MQRRHRFTNNGSNDRFRLIWMSHKRKAYTPFSTSSEAGVTAAPVEGFIQVTQDVRPTIDTGFVDSKGQWIGHVTSDIQFSVHSDGVAIANTGYFLTPSVNADGTWPLDMTGFCDIILALKPTNGGQYGIDAIMGDGNSFANLSPLDAAATLRGTFNAEAANFVMTQLLSDSNETLTADVWNIFYIQGRLSNQKVLQFKITNASGGISTIETAFMRMV